MPLNRAENPRLDFDVVVTKPRLRHTFLVLDSASPFHWTQLAATSLRYGLLGLLFLATGLAPWPDPTAEAAPIRIRARTTLDVKVIRQDGGLRLSGLLTDELGQGVPARELHVHVRGMVPPQLTTSTRGAFDVRIEAVHLEDLESREGRHLEWSASYDGDSTYGAASASGTMDLMREPTWLKLRVTPQPVRVGIDEMRVDALLYADEEALPSEEIELRIDNGPALTGTADDQGRATFVVRSLDLGRAGPLNIEAHFRGSKRYDGCKTNLVTNLLHATRTTLRVGREGSRHTGRYRFSGRATYQGGGLPHSTVNIIATGTPASGSSHAEGETISKLVLVTSTDDHGIYLGAISAKDLFADFEDTVHLQAVGTPDPTRYIASQSQGLDVRVPGGPMMTTRWYAWALAWVLCLVGLIQAIRLRLWRSVWNWFINLKKRLFRPADTPALGAFIELNNNEAVARRNDWLGGQVMDKYSKMAVGDAYVELTSDNGPSYSTSTNADGSFSLGVIPSGRWTLEVSSPGYAVDSSVITFPHNGGLDGARLVLTSDKHSARLAFAKRLDGAGHQWRWGYETIRDALHRVASGRIAPREELDSDARDLEAVWYGPDELAVDSSEGDGSV